MKNLIQPANDAEAQALKSLLRQHGIESRIISFHDTAYDGLFQSQYGWGVIKVAEANYEEAARIVREWKDSSPDEVPWEDSDTNPGEGKPSGQ